MGGFDWQTGVALAIVAATVVWLGWRVLRLIKGRSAGSCGSGGCGSCGAHEKTDDRGGRELPLVSLDKAPGDGK